VHAELAGVLLGPEYLWLTSIVTITAALNGTFWWVLFRRWGRPGWLFAPIPVLQAFLFLSAIGSSQALGYDPSSSLAIGPGLAILVALLGPMALFHFAADKPLSQENLHELDKLKLAKFGRTSSGFFFDPGMLCGGPLATYLIIRKLRQIQAERTDPKASSTIENYWSTRYPIYVPATRRKLVITAALILFLVVYIFGFPIAVGGQSEAPIIFAILLSVIPLLVVVFIGLLLNPVLHHLEIRQDEAVFVTLSGRRRIPFRRVASFTAGHWVSVNY